LAGEGVGKDEGHTMAWFVLTDGVGRLATVSGGTCRWSFGSGGGGVGSASNGTGWWCGVV
jgi:hypothetical protein